MRDTVFFLSVCIRACMDALEKSDRIENKFHNKFFYKKSWEIPNKPTEVSKGVNPYREAYLDEHYPGIRENEYVIQAFGIDIVVDRKVQNRYYIGTRHFETPEVKLLIDAVQSARFITPKKSKELIAHLSTFISTYETIFIPAGRSLIIPMR